MSFVIFLQACLNQNGTAIYKSAFPSAGIVSVIICPCVCVYLRRSMTWRQRSRSGWGRRCGACCGHFIIIFVIIAVVRRSSFPSEVAMFLLLGHPFGSFTASLGIACCFPSGEFLIQKTCRRRLDASLSPQRHLQRLQRLEVKLSLCHLLWDA